MIRWKNLFFNIGFAFNCLLLFLLIFSEKLVVPAWLQVAGRMHPLLLHFPIVIIVLYVLWLLLAKSNSHYQEIGQDLLLLAAFSAALTALCGILLSKELGYDAEALQTHKWAGCIISVLLIFWYWLSTIKRLGRWIDIAASFIMLLLIVIAGDLGAAITHGDNFLMAPVTPQKEKKVVVFEEALVYADLVQPILDAKCLSCHNSKKAKGELVMETAALLTKGGKDGKLWDTTQQDLGLLMRRIHLPEDEKEHMPPSGKPQLTDEEVVILQAWIKAGADVQKKVINLLPTDTLRMLAYKRLKTSTEEKYNFPVADETKVKELNNTNRVIYPVAVKSPALVAKFYNSQYFNSKQLEELYPLRQQIIELNLSKMAVKDDDLKKIASFTNLRILNLNYSAITGKNLNELKKLPFLKSLSLSGTPVTVDNLSALQKFPKLKSVFVWNTRITKNDLSAINKQGKIHFETGFNGEKVTMKLTPPIIENEELISNKAFPIKLKQYISGTVIRYTTDGTDPDSTTSPVYSNNVNVESIFQFKARAVKAGWYCSDIISKNFYFSKFVPDSAVLLKPADEKFKAASAHTLIDLIKSDASKGTGKWLGFQKNDCEALFIFHQPVKVSSITISFLKDIGGSVFPPSNVEFWGGKKAGIMRLLARITPKMPVKGEGNDVLAINGNFTETELSYIKIIAKPVAKLPAWHTEKGKKAWLLIDEVMIN